jgi:hypothetical protein
MSVFWVVATCSLVEFYQRFRGPCCLHHQGDVISQRGSVLMHSRQAVSHLLSKFGFHQLHGRVLL